MNLFQLQFKFLFLKQAIKESKLLDLNLTHIMNTWTKQMGHPVVKINFLNNTHIEIFQNHFLLDKALPSKSEYK